MSEDDRGTKEAESPQPLISGHYVAEPRLNLTASDDDYERDKLWPERSK